VLCWPTRSCTDWRRRRLWPTVARICSRRRLVDKVHAPAFVRAVGNATSPRCSAMWLRRRSRIASGGGEAVRLIHCRATRYSLDMAHVLLAHARKACRHMGVCRRNLRECEAEMVALLCCAPDLPGIEYSRGYIQSWCGSGNPNSRTSAQRILKAAVTSSRQARRRRRPSLEPVVYARVSTVDRKGRTSWTRLRRYVAARGWTAVATLIAPSVRHESPAAPRAPPPQGRKQIDYSGVPSTFVDLFASESAGMDSSNGRNAAALFIAI
jgi:hypothetical protein